MVYIFSAIQTAFIIFNQDILAGEASDKLNVDSNALVRNLTILNTIIGLLNVLGFATYSSYADDDYIAASETITSTDEGTEVTSESTETTESTEGSSTDGSTDTSDSSEVSEEASSGLYVVFV